MEANTIQLLKECSSGCKMAAESVENVKDYVKTDKLRDLLDAYADKHREIEREVIGLLEDYGKEDEDPSKMAEMCSWFDIKVKMLMHSDEHQIAKLMMDGCNMGIQSLSEYVNKYPDASKESQNLAKKLIKVEEDFMKEMKAWC